MEWIAEGITLCFIGLIVMVLVFYIGANEAATHLVARVCAFMLFILAGVSAFTGARTTILPMKFCPFIKSTVGIFYIVASLL